VHPRYIRLKPMRSGPLGAYLAYRAMRRSSVRGSWPAMVGNVVIMVALLVAIFAVLGWFAYIAGAS